MVIKAQVEKYAIEGRIMCNEKKRNILREFHSLVA
jgi:hypothetical protein